MTEYDLTAKQLEEVIQVAARAAAREHWGLVLDYAEEIKMFAQHLRALRASNAPRASDAPQAN